MTARKTRQDPAEEVRAEERAGEPAAERDGKKDDFKGIPDPFVYCGPSVRGVARQYTTFQGGIPGPLKELIRQHPAVRSLIVPTGRFADVRRKLETIGTAEYIVYQKVRSEL